MSISNQKKLLFMLKASQYPLSFKSYGSFSPSLALFLNVNSKFYLKKKSNYLKDFNFRYSQNHLVTSMFFTQCIKTKMLQEKKKLFI